MRMSTTQIGRAWKAFGITAVTIVASGPALGQGVDVPIATSHVETTSPTVVTFDYGHAFETDTDNNGNLSRNNASFDLRHRIALNQDLGITIAGGYQLSAYDFSGAANPTNGASNGAGSFQWDDVHEGRIVGLVDWKVSEKWTLLGAAVVVTHVEGGGDLADAMTAGAAFGFDYQATEGLKLGLLVGATTGIEDSATLLPIPRVDWRFADGWRWRIDMISAFGARGIGTELSVRASDQLEFAVGVTRQRKRFRLASHGGSDIDRGVGEESSVPVFARMSYMPAANIHLDVRAGVALKGDTRAETKTGRQVESDTYDAAPIVGIGGLITF